MFRLKFCFSFIHFSLSLFLWFHIFFHFLLSSFVRINKKGKKKRKISQWSFLQSFISLLAQLNYLDLVLKNRKRFFSQLIFFVYHTEDLPLTQIIYQFWKNIKIYCSIFKAFSVALNISKHYTFGKMKAWLKSLIKENGLVCLKINFIKISYKFVNTLWMFIFKMAQVVKYKNYKEYKNVKTEL